ncbi:S-methyl-5-thioribose kinase [Saxibacter everestensis]|uniref:S-methyl-5-thioribose kinase n=1 Tax=Saxibacter everestensis TaxID=2909229 RepID=A0ABY8QS38_9MICO|nr:S-methyl-5-thioribose kinase [Brevibacteriaceae bacterium ZFBP1038]
MTDQPVAADSPRDSAVAETPAADSPTAEAPAADYALLGDADDVIGYLREHDLLHLLAGPSGENGAEPADGNAEPVDAGIVVHEVTAGNMNRVFIARRGGRGVAVKQAPPWVQVAGPDWPADPSRSAAEARAYDYLARLTPEAVPTIHYFDQDQHVLVMEDLSDLEVLRDFFVAEVASSGPGGSPALGGTGIDIAAVGEVVGRFIGELSFATSDIGMGSADRKALIAAAVNPDLCRMTEDVLLDEPYREHEHNKIPAGFEADARALYANTELRRELSVLRHRFMSCAQALLHGDLHSGSVMVGRRDLAQVTTVFDPEFSFVGPIGFDLGLFWSNLSIAADAARAVGLDSLAWQRDAAIGTSWGAFVSAWRKHWSERADTVFSDDYLEVLLAEVFSDAVGYAGIESVRRVVGYSHAADLESLPDWARAGAQRVVLNRAVRWITGRHDYASPAELTGAVLSPAGTTTE